MTLTTLQQLEAIDSVAANGDLPLACSFVSHWGLCCN